MRLETSLRLVVAFSLTLPVAARAQATAGSPPFTPFRDTALLKPSAGHPVDILEFEDLECPACAHAFPIVHAAVDKYKIPLERHDFLIQGHAWSKDAAIMARYLQDKVSPELAEEYRRDVFANQVAIAGRDDLQSFTRNWFQKHGKPMPFAVDPTGRFAAEVQADCTMGERLGLIHTPTIVVLTPKGWTEVTDVSQLYTVLDKAIAQNPPTPAARVGPHGGPRKPSAGSVQN